MNMKRDKGLSIVELVITMFIVLLVLSGAYFTYTNLLKGFKQETISVETEIEKLVGTELLRLDLEHAGYGMGEDEPFFPIEWYEDASLGSYERYMESKKLIIRATLNNTNKKTYGWILFKCSSSSIPLKDSIVVDSRLDKTNNSIVLLDDRKKIASTSTDLKLTDECPNEGVFLGFPIDRDYVNKVGKFDCRFQICHAVNYTFSTSNPLGDCNPNTKNLLREGKPILDCVADMKIQYWLDTNQDGKIDKVGSSPIELDNDHLNETKNNDFVDLDGDGKITSPEIRKQLKLISVYLLMQDGKKDPEFVFDAPSGYVETQDNVKLRLPPDFQHYRWKVIKITVKPINF